MSKQKAIKLMEREKEHHLALWCMEQAKLHHEGKLSKDKIKRLKDINFPFDHYLALYDKHHMTFEEFEKDKSVDEMGIPLIYTLQRWVIKDKGKREWEIEIVIIKEQFNKIEEIVKKYPKGTFRLLDDDFEVIALKTGKDKSLNFK